MNEVAQEKKEKTAVTLPDHPELSPEHVENGNELGSVQIHNSVIASITRVAALKVPGVIELPGGIVDGLAGMIGKKGGDRGIRVEFEETSVAIELNVILAFGVRIPHVAWQIQTEVRKAVEQMTGKPVKAVNVIIQGVRMAPEPKAVERVQDAEETTP